MQSALALLLILFTLSSHAQSNQQKLKSITELKRIAFGSCSNENDYQPLWKDVIRQKPDLWIWGGDNVYADWGKSDSVARAYQKQNAHPDYALLKSTTPIIGTWDDHDYAWDNAGGDLSFKQMSQKLHLDFMDVPVDSPRKKQEGIYTSFNFGEGDQKIKIIILDNRYFKDIEDDAPMLGNQQWVWLENEFKNSKANLHFIIGGLSVFSPTIPYSEEWWHYPIEVKRMRKLLQTYEVKAPVFLTGDKHFSTIFKYWGQLEFMSSGLTHTAPRRTWWYLARKYPITYFGISYGIVDIEWEGSTPKLKMTIRNGERDVFIRNVVWKNKTWNFF
ncbi:MAG: alkaline phosphatase D family protein [Bacteriovoracia bacterium]